MAICTSVFASRHQSRFSRVGAQRGSRIDPGHQAADCRTGVGQPVLYRRKVLAEQMLEGIQGEVEFGGDAAFEAATLATSGDR